MGLCLAPLQQHDMPGQCRQGSQAVAVVLVAPGVQAGAVQVQAHDAGVARQQADELHTRVSAAVLQLHSFRAAAGWHTCLLVMGLPRSVTSRQNSSLLATRCQSRQTVQLRHRSCRAARPAQLTCWQAKGQRQLVAAGSPGRSGGPV